MRSQQEIVAHLRKVALNMHRNTEPAENQAATLIEEQAQRIADLEQVAEQFANLSNAYNHLEKCAQEMGFNSIGAAMRQAKGAVSMLTPEQQEWIAGAKRLMRAAGKYSGWLDEATRGNKLFPPRENSAS